MSEILTESSSQRSDNKIWVWKYPDSVFTPFKVNLRRLGVEGTYIDIPTTYSARFVVKADLRDDNSIIDEFFKFVSPSVFVVNIPTEKVCLLRAGRLYHVGVALYDDNNNFIRSLISDLPLRLDKSTLSNLVF